MREFTNDELVAALEQIKERVPELFNPTKYGFSYEARTWVDSFEKNIDFTIDKLTR